MSARGGRNGSFSFAAPLAAFLITRAFFRGSLRSPEVESLLAGWMPVGTKCQPVCCKPVKYTVI